MTMAMTATMNAMKLHMKSLGQGRTVAIVLLLFAAGCAGTRELAIVDVAVVDVAAGRVLEGQTVIVRGNVITQVGRVPVPPGAQQIDGRGKYLIPGLWDMHVHLQAAGEESLSLFLANGVVGVRDMGSDDDFVIPLRDRIASGAVTGPTVRTSGAMLDDAPPEWPFRLRTTNAKDAVARNVDFIKVHSRLPRDAYFAVIEEAKRRNLPVAGHVPEKVTMAEASKAGQRSIEHLGEYKLLFECGPSCESLFATFRENRTWHTPTLAALRTFSLSEKDIEAELRASGQLEHVTPTLLAFWQKSMELTPPPPEPVRQQLAGLFERAVPLVGEMHKTGVPLLAGCDALVPGYCLHDELAWLVRAGLTPVEALRTATLNPAIYFGEDHQRGTIEPGKRADLVLLGADPTTDIANTRTIEAVIVGGKMTRPGVGARPR